MKTIKINGVQANEEAALNALIRYAQKNVDDAFLRANCPHGAPYTLGDLDYLLVFAVGRAGYVIDRECVDLLARAGVDLSDSE